MHQFFEVLSRMNGRVLTAILFLAAAAGTAADSVDDLIVEEMEQRRILGLQLAIVQDDQILKLANYGSIDSGQNYPVSSNTLFPINSITKAFTGTLIVQLAAQDKLELADTLGAHLDGLPLAWQEITISQILGHVSGLPVILSGNLAALIGDGSDESAWQRVQQLPLQGQPGNRFSYNQTGYAVLGKLIEKYNERSYSDVLERLLRDTGMAQTADYDFGQDSSSTLDVSQQYIYSHGGFQLLPIVYSRLIWPAGGMASTAEELAKFVIALQSGALLDADHLSQLWTPVRLNDGGTAGFSEMENGYAAGWQVIQRDQHPAVSASGADASTLILYPHENLAVIVLTNSLNSLPIEFVDSIAEQYR